jgi:putative ribosome biogenesis GTPase RsgA
MFLLTTGASGVGKSSVRATIAPELESEALRIKDMR